ncbi:(2Fe-2S)-binding protein [Silvibacterium acidisoli]|uniref:(2Fe-2S)-binding protein n=1 Tax=Acidobacteriaceae bacterium ZG23-2 TaxID=2883246 RepID=UPI00406C77E2
MKKQPDPSKKEDTEQAEKPVFGRFSRRSFLSQLGAAGVAATTAPLAHAATPAVDPAQSENPAGVPGAVPVTLRVNGKEHQLMLEPRVTLLDALRENLAMPGTKKGCDHGQCGACTVHINGRRVNSCLSFAVMHQLDEITTIEGLANGGELHPVQQAFLQHDGFQCGYCTPGQIMSGAALLKEPIGPTDDDVRIAMSGNICRCGAYTNIVAAVQQARGRRA